MIGKLHHCSVLSCIRHIYGDKTKTLSWNGIIINSFSIERTCPYKDTSCPDALEDRRTENTITIFRKDYCQCEKPRICGFGPYSCSLGCGKTIRKTVSELRNIVKWFSQYGGRRKVREYLKNALKQQETS